MKASLHLQSLVAPPAEPGRYLLWVFHRGAWVREARHQLHSRVDLCLLAVQ